MPIEKVRGYLDPKAHLDKWIAILTMIGMCWGGLSFIDSRYVRASDYTQDMAELKRSTDLFRADIRTALYAETTNLRKGIVGDILFDLDFKRRSNPKEWTALDEARYQKYLREYAELEQKLSTYNNFPFQPRR